MVVRVNGEEREVPAGSTIQQLLGVFQLEKKSVVFELNRKVIDRNAYEQTRLQEGDQLEIVHFVGGG